VSTPILFLLGAVALSALGGLVVWIASRPRPERFGSTIDTFTRDLDALAPPGSRQTSQTRGMVRTGQSEHGVPGEAQAGASSTPAPSRPGPRPTGRPGGN
jgi:hypothetical protein